MKRCLIYYCLPALLMLLYCCCKKTNNYETVVQCDHPFEYDDSATSVSFMYQQGTYWIYRDSLSGRIDSFFVNPMTFVYFTTKAACDPSQKNYLITISETNTDGTYPADSATWAWELIENSVNVYYTRDSGVGIREGDYEPFFNYPLGTNIQSNLDTASIVNTFGNYVLNGNSYADVTEIQHYLPGSFNDQFFINDTTGIIKMRLFHSSDNLAHVWELQRYKIVR